MPLYEYECQNGHRFERIQKFSDPPVEVCPTCGSPVQKLVSSPAFQFKGTGWYVTDYAKKGDAKAESKTDSNSESKADTKSESKTETKTETKSETASASPPASPAPKT